MEMLNFKPWKKFKLPILFYTDCVVWTFNVSSYSNYNRELARHSITHSQAVY